MRRCLQLLGGLIVGLLFLQPSSLSESGRRIEEIRIGETDYDDRTIVAIEELFVNPAWFDTKHVRVTGTVGDQDPHGYWLYLTDQKVRIYIEVPLHLTQIAGKTVTIYGTVNVQHGIPSIIATEVR